ncbi:MAG TPA: hypothetical protein VGL89_05570 [Candidatus Koribacter sp.]|jgi:hypothetical protein
MRLNIPRVVPVAGLLIGFPGLLRALLMLDQDPVVAVLGLLAAMALLLASVACLFRDDDIDSIQQAKDRSSF